MSEYARVWYLLCFKSMRQQIPRSLKSPPAWGRSLTYALPFHKTYAADITPPQGFSRTPGLGALL